MIRFCEYKRGLHLKFIENVVLDKFYFLYGPLNLALDTKLNKIFRIKDSAQTLETLSIKRKFSGNYFLETVFPGDTLSCVYFKSFEKLEEIYKNIETYDFNIYGNSNLKPLDDNHFRLILDD